MPLHLLETLVSSISSVRFRLVPNNDQIETDRKRWIFYCFHITLGEKRQLKPNQLIRCNCSISILQRVGHVEIRCSPLGLNIVNVFSSGHVKPTVKCQAFFSHVDCCCVHTYAIAIVCLDQSLASLTNELFATTIYRPQIIRRVFYKEPDTLDVLPIQKCKIARKDLACRVKEVFLKISCYFHD